VNYTDNYNLRKPEPTDPVDIQDLNYNTDAIDGKLKEIEDWEAAHLQASNPHSITPALIGAETPAGAQAKVDEHEQKAAPHSGHETPAGAQEKASAALAEAKLYAENVAISSANSALNNANNYTNQVAAEINQRIDETRVAVQEISAELVTHKTDTMPHKFEDLKNTVTYKFGFQLSAEGNPQIIFEEVV